MNCKTSWNDKFISKALLPSFFKNQYKKHTNKNSIQEQLSLLPDTQPDVELIIKKEKAQKERIKLISLQYELREKIIKIKDELTIEIIENITNKNQQDIDKAYKEEQEKPKKDRISKATIKKQLTKYKKTIKKEALEIVETIKDEKCKEEIISIEEINNKIIILNKIIDNNKKNKIIYNRPCSNTSCNGMLKYQSNLCGICDHITCSKCLEAYNKNNTEHICNPDNIKTAELIKKDTKYCPKCNFGITKISGCDVMFCTQCNTSFNWKTMEVLTKNLHNPHYIEYLRRNGNSRERQNMINNCIANPAITDYDMRRFVNIKNFCEKVELFKPFNKTISIGIKIIQYILHINDEVQRLRDKIRRYENLNRESRINLLRNNIKQAEFEKSVTKNCYEIRILKQKEQICSTITDISTELIFNISNNELMAINNSIFNILDSSTTTNSFQKISNNSEEFFSRFISINNFTRVMKELCRIVTEILKINRHCINEDQEISKMYGRTFNIMLYNVGF
tara:strand:+ start:265 stop:1791 length:1527 start_codon:yes stop_codon:yes gene_type:complete